MSAAREKDQADFDLERFIDMFDEALSSRDPRVIDALRGLMMIVTLTRSESRHNGLHDRNAGPLRRLFEDVNHLNNRLYRAEDEIRHLTNKLTRAEPPYRWEEEDKYTMMAAAQVSQKVEQGVLNQLKSTYQSKIQGLK